MESVEEVIPRTTEAQEILDKFGYYLDEFMNFGSHVIKWETDTARGSDEDLPLELLLRHFLELLDSVSILARNASIDPCKLILRGMLEASFGIEYILEKNTHDRAMCFLLCHTHKKLKTYKKFDQTSSQGKKYQKDLNSDKSYKEIDLSKLPQTEIQKAIKNSESILRLPKYHNYEKEYQRSVKTGSKNPNWYSLFNGPRNIKDLADYLNRTGLYEILYRHWSGSIHATDIIDGNISSSKTGTVDFIQIRYLKDAQSVVSHTMNLALTVFQLIIDHRIPTKKSEYTTWYLIVRDTFMEISSGKNNIIQIK
jgi:hypothetical protein